MGGAKIKRLPEEVTPIVAQTIMNLLLNGYRIIDPSGVDVTDAMIAEGRSLVEDS